MSQESSYDGNVPFPFPFPFPFPHAYSRCTCFTGANPS